MGSGHGVAAHPVAQLSFRINPTPKPPQSTHRPRSPRTHTFHTIYDNDGRLTRSNRLFLNYNERIDYVFDAAGALLTSVSEMAPQCEDPGTNRTTWFWTDGDGQTAARRVTAIWRTNGQIVEDGKKFRIRSSVVDQVISEVYSDGTRFATYTYAFDEVVLRQQYGAIPNWEHRDPSNAMFSSTRIDQSNGTDSGGALLDPSGSPVGSGSPTQCESNLFDDWWSYNFGPSSRRGACEYRGAEMNCGLLMRLEMIDAAESADRLARRTQRQTIPQDQKPKLKLKKKGESKKRKKERERLGIEVNRDEEDYVPFNPDAIRRGVERVWNNPDCRNLITEMLQAVSGQTGVPLESNGDLSVLFDRLMKGKGGLSRKPPSGGQMHGGAATGTFGGNNATVHIPGNISNPNYTVHDQLVKDVTTTVDELMHLSGKRRYSDREFARTVRDNSTWSTSNWQDNYYKKPQVYPDNNPALTPAQRELLRSDHLPYSGYWHPVLDNLCFSKVDFSGL